MYTIYTLEDQRYVGLQAIRYVGITDDVYIRFYQHLRCDGSNKEKDDWIKGMKHEQVMMIMRTLEQVETLEGARDREQYWIRHYLDLGVTLLNIQISSPFSFDDFINKMNELKDPSKVSSNEHPITDLQLLPIEDFMYRVEGGTRKRNLYISFEDAVKCTGYTVEELRALARDYKIRLSANRLMIIVSSLKPKPYLGENVLKRKRRKRR